MFFIENLKLEKKVNIRSKLLHLNWILANQFGLDFYRFITGVSAIPNFLYQLFQFKNSLNKKVWIRPCLHDRRQEGGATKSEYFWQDLIVAREVFKANPHKHVDIGSRVDGFVGHVATFREIEIFDVRPISTKIPNVVFRQADFMSLNPLSGVDVKEGYCDSLSSLHALEHFGLGRYGDPIDQNVYKKGLKNMASL